MQLNFSQGGQYLSQVFPSKKMRYGLHLSFHLPDHIVQQLLQTVFKSVELLARRMLADHLPGGTWEEADELTREQTKLVTKTNTVSERDFGKLDRLLREKPNASTLALEAHILFSNNKTAKWLRERSQAEQDNLVKMARSLAPAYKQKFKEPLASIQQQRRQALEMCEHELQRKEQSLLLKKKSWQVKL